MVSNPLVVRKNQTTLTEIPCRIAFTASLVICGRWLLAKHGQNSPDAAAIAQCQELLNRAQAIFQGLHPDEALVYSCSSYIGNLSDMLNSQGRCPAVASRKASYRLANHAYAEPIPSEETSGDVRLTASESQSEDASAQASSAVFLNTEWLEAFEFLNSELLEPPAFEGFGWAMDGTLRGIV
jgi:hypothetical protein